MVTIQHAEEAIREAKRQQQEIAIGEAAMEIARVIHGKGYQVEVLPPHIAFIVGEAEEQMAVRIRWIAPGAQKGTEAVVVHKAIEQMMNQAKLIPDARAAGLLTPLPVRASRPKGFA